MATPKIYLLEEKPLMFYQCQMCGENTRKNKFAWESRLTGAKLAICRECAYRERYGTKNMRKAKKEKLLEEKSTNQ